MIHGRLWADYAILKSNYNSINQNKILINFQQYFRFAEFMETSAHISADAVDEHEKELEDYDTEYNDESISEDDNSSEDIKKLEYTSDSE